MAKRKPKSGSLFDGDADVVDTTPARRRGPGGRPSARGGPGPLPQLRTLGHHLARPARRARRAQAGAAPHPLHDVAAEPHRRRQAPQVRQGRRRRDGQLPSARRLGALRNARPHGAGRSRCATRWSTAPATSARSMAIPPRRCAIPSAASRASATRCCARSTRRRWRSGRTTTARAPSRSCCRRGFPTCSSTAPPASPSAWRPTSRRTTSARCARRSSSCSTTPI